MKKKKWQPKSLWPRCKHCGLHANGPECVSKEKCDKKPLGFDVKPMPTPSVNKETAREILERVIVEGKGFILLQDSPLILIKPEEINSITTDIEGAECDGWCLECLGGCETE